MFRSRRLYLYVLTELVVPTLLGLFFYTFALLMNAFFLIARTAVAKNLAWDLTLRLFVFETPKILVLAIPMAVLLGTLIAMGRLSADHEWVALQSAGLGPSFLVRPIALFGVIASLLSFFVYAAAVPMASYASRHLFGEVLMASNLVSDLRPRVFYDDLPGVVLYVDEIRPGTEGRLEGVLIYQPAAEGGFDQLVVARQGDLYPPATRSGALDMTLRDGVLHAYRSASPETYRVSRFGRYHLQFKPPAYLQGLDAPLQKTVQDMTLRELLREREEARTDQDPVLRSYRVRRVAIEIQQRIALPFVCLLFSLLAFPLGATRARAGKGAGFALSLAVILVYWLVFTLARDQAARGNLPVLVGVWSANLVIGVWAAYAYWRLARGRERESGVLTGFGGILAALRRKDPPASSGPPAPADTGPPSGEASPIFLSNQPSRFLGLVDRYIVGHYVRMLLLALLSIYLVYGIVELKGLLDGVFQNHQPIWLVARYFKYFAPGMIRTALPVACLVGGVVAFTLLGRRGELTALKASGISMRRAMAPVIGVTVLLCGLLFLIQDRITPVTNRKAQEIRDQISGRAPRTYGMPPSGRWSFGSEGRLYQYRLYDPVQQTFQGLSVFTLDRATLRILDHRFASTARWDGSAWHLEKGWYRSFPDRGPVGEFRRFEQPERVALDPPEAFSRGETTLAVGSDLPEQMSLEELGQQIRTLRNSGYDTTRLQVAFFAKLSHPFTPLVMLLLGLPFAFRTGRGGSLYAVGIALGLVIVYWATFAIFNALGLETILPPLLAAWAPNILYSLFGTYLLLYVKT